MQKIKFDKGKGQMFTFVGPSSCAALELMDKEPRADALGMSDEKRTTPLTQEEVELLEELSTSVTAV